MDKTKVISQIYGYAVCLIAIIVILVSITSLVGAFFNLADPIRANDFKFGNFNSQNLSSFEQYKADALRNGFTTSGTTTVNGTTTTTTMTPSDEELRTAYNAAREDKIASVKLSSYQTITIDAILMVISLVLFFTHWKWVTKHHSA